MRPEGEVFDARWRQRTTLVKCAVSDVRVFIQAHYLHRKPGVTVACFVVRVADLGDQGCLLFALPPRETHKRYGGVTWELARLYLTEVMPTNSETWVIAQGLRWIRRYRKDVQFVVSYADPSVSHTGVIYRASNFRLDGRTDDERKSPRFDYVCANTGKHYSRKGHVPKGTQLIRKPRVSKYRYVIGLAA